MNRKLHKRLIYTIIMIITSIILYIYTFRVHSFEKLIFFFNQTSLDKQKEINFTHVTHRLRICSDELLNPMGRLYIENNAPSWDELVKKYASSVIQPKISLQEKYNTYTMDQTVYSNKSLNLTGVWRPIECEPSESLALIIPYRNRDLHLRIFLNHMHPFLRHQNLMFTIFVVDQNGTSNFNRAALMNIGFVESHRVAKFDCFIFHDVDLLPENDQNLYRCSSKPRHLSVAVNKFDYRLPYATLFGGAISMTREQFTKVNGFSNAYFGWGGEDDDMYARVRNQKYEIIRYPAEIARYTMISHSKDLNNPVNPQRNALLSSASSRFQSDGFKTTNYTLISAYPAYNGLVYWIKVDIRPENNVPH